MARTFVDDNFGVWEDMDDPDNVEFYHAVQRESVLKVCDGCGCKMKLRPDYSYCNSCATKRERGWDGWA